MEVLYPNEAIVRTALRGAAFEHDRMYGTVRVVNPFVPSAG